jgi:hypothetical protein
MIVFGSLAVAACLSTSKPANGEPLDKYFRFNPTVYGPGHIRLDEVIQQKMDVDRRRGAVIAPPSR